MRNLKLYLRIVALVTVVVVLAGCPQATTPNPPPAAKPPQVRVLEFIQIGAQANNAAAHTLKVMCQPTPPATPQASAETCSTAADYMRLAARTFDALAAEAASQDAWPVMRIKLASIASSVSVGQVVTNPVLAANIAAIQSAILLVLGVQ